MEHLFMSVPSFLGVIGVNNVLLCDKQKIAKNNSFNLNEPPLQMTMKFE